MLIAITAATVAILLFVATSKPPRRPEVILRLPPPSTATARGATSSGATTPGTATPGTPEAGHTAGTSNGVEVTVKPSTAPPPPAGPATMGGPTTTGGPAAAGKELAVPAQPEKASGAGENGAAVTGGALPASGTEVPSPPGGVLTKGVPSGTEGAAQAESSATPAQAETTAGSGSAAPAGDAAAAAKIIVGPATVTRGSNLRADAGIEAAIIGFVRVGERIQVLDDKPVRGYYRVAFGARKGWLWGANIAAADPDAAPAN